MIHHQFRKTFAEIRHQYLINNYRALCSLVSPDTFICPMVKCNAYGHGAVEVSQTLEREGVKALGVALIEEAIELRLAKIEAPDILVFGMFGEDGARAFIDYRLTPVISSLQQLEILQRVISPRESLSIHVKIDTGMKRLGLPLQDLHRLKEKYLHHQDVSSRLRVTGLCTHLVNGEDLAHEHSYSKQQLERLLSAEKMLGVQLVKHGLNSSAMISQYSCPSLEISSIGVRPGIALYGGGLDSRQNFPFSSQEWIKKSLKPVMILKSELVMIHELKAGDTVSYGATWRAQRDQRVGVLAFGYGDGYPRAFSNCGKVLLNHHLVPVIGRVCMDYTMVDLSIFTKEEIPKLGDLAIFFGDDDNHLSASHLANELDTISYEIFTGISQRVPRVHVR